MAQSENDNHEYYCNYETCRNRWFDGYEPDSLQNEDCHLNLTHRTRRKK